MELRCNDCPRRCNVDRSARVGRCGMGEHAEVARISGRPFMLHKYEEPIISGDTGTAAVFFCGCNLGCVYCQNGVISRRGRGVTLSTDELARLFVTAAASGGRTLSLITAGHFIRPVSAALAMARPDIHIPVVYNSSGYESTEAIDRLADTVDVFLPDFKYMDGARAARYSAAPEYPEVAVAAIRRMVELRPEPIVENGILKRGVLIRHLVLPGGRRDSAAVLRAIKAHFPAALVSIMRQYTPAFCPDTYPELRRTVTSFEYESTVELAAELGLNGFRQDKDSADTKYTPDFG